MFTAICALVTIVKLQRCDETATLCAFKRCGINTMDFVVVISGMMKRFNEIAVGA